MRFIRIDVRVSPKRFVGANSDILEQTWTACPVLVLARIALPRIYLLCLQDNYNFSNIRRKIIASQWRWQSEIYDNEGVDHLLDTGFIDVASYETVFYFKARSLIRLMVRRIDVLHSLGMPNLGIKLDAIPGRLNATILDTSVQGITVGSCFELCGSGHRMIPLNWLFF